MFDPLLKRFPVFILFAFDALSASAQVADSLQKIDPLTCLQDYVRIESVSGREKRAAQYFEAVCRAKGLHIRVFTAHDSSYNFAASLYPLDLKKPNVCFLSHIDVVTSGERSEWRHPPYDGVIEDSILWGRGTLDVKGLAVMHLFGLLDYVKEHSNDSLQYNYTMLLVSGEETGGFNGAKIVADSFLHELNAVAIFGEGGAGIDSVIPSKPNVPIFGISVAEKTNLWLKLEMRYTTFGHGAAPPGNYVNKSMLKAFNKLSSTEGHIEFNKTTKRMFKMLGEWEGGGKGFVLKNIHWPIFRPVLKRLIKREPDFDALLRNTAVLTNIFNPPGPPNKLSSKVTAYLDCRLLPGTNRRKFIREIKYGLFEPRFKVSIINECPDAEESSPETPYFRAMQVAIQKHYPTAKVMPILFPASSDNNYFREKGIPVYGITPMWLNRSELQSIHNIDERIPIPQLYKGIGIFKMLIQTLEAK